SCRVALCLRPPTLCPASALPKPLESAITKNVPVNPLESALTKSLDLNPLEMNSYKKAGGSPSSWPRIFLCQSAFIGVHLGLHLLPFVGRVFLTAKGNPCYICRFVNQLPSRLVYSLREFSGRRIHVSRRVGLVCHAG